MGKSTTGGYWRQKGATGGTPAVGVNCIQFTLDPTAASADTGKVLPIGSIPIWVSNINGGATGGASPTIDVGISSNDDGFAAELPADAISAPVVTGALIGVELTANTAIYAGVGASAATGGSVIVGVYYIMADTGL